MIPPIGATGHLVSLLQTYGGLGLSAILMFVIYYLYKQNTSLQDQRNTAIKEQYEKLFDLMEKRIETDIKHENAFHNLREIIKELITKF